jgi:hypothetical protein
MRNADVLLLLETCQAGGLAFAAQDHTSTGRMEVITVCSYPNVALSNYQFSFNNTLVKTPKENAYRGKTFTTATLYLGILTKVFRTIHSLNNLNSDGQSGSAGIFLPAPMHINLGRGHNQLTNIASRPLSSQIGDLDIGGYRLPFASDDSVVEDDRAKFDLDGESYDQEASFYEELGKMRN